MSIFDKKTITEKIQSYEDACKVLHVKSKVGIFEHLDKHEVAYIKLTTIIRALNERWIPDWDNPYTFKYYCYFHIKNKSLDNAYVTNGTSYANSNVSPYMTFKDENLANYAMSQFKDLYLDFMT